jgi:hypothetical protein
MVPFFSSGAGYGNDDYAEQRRNQTIQRKLDNQTGSLNNLEYKPKMERRPLFNPLVGLTNIYGSPVNTDYYESRYIPSRFRNNEKPFQETKVTPGLNLGYNEVSMQGYHDMYRALPKTANELRTLNNPKLTYNKPIIHGMKGEKRGVLPNMKTRKVQTFTENDPKDMMKSMGYIKGPKVRENYNVAPTNRSINTKEYIGPAKFNDTMHKPESLLEKHKISHKQNYLHDGPRNLGRTGTDKATAVDYSDIPALTVKDLISMATRIGTVGT